MKEETKHSVVLREVFTCGEAMWYILQICQGDTFSPLVKFNEC